MLYAREVTNRKSQIPSFTNLEEKHGAVTVVKE